MSRIESPSSINTYNQCPRKYYYHYIKELPCTPSIYLVRGKIVHSVLENFYDIGKNIKTEDDLRIHLFWLLEKTWNENLEELSDLGMSSKELQRYYDESYEMLQTWFSRFSKKLRNLSNNGQGFTEAFKQLTPRREEEFNSEEYQVRGFIDVIYESDSHVIIMDYKTSKRPHLSPEYRLQLGIYAAMYEEKHGKRPDFVGIDFLKHQELIVPVDEAIVEEAKKEIKEIHTKTTSEKIEHYPMKPSALCKWSNGQCDYYEQCIGKE